MDQMLRKEEYEARHAALDALSVVAEGTRSFLKHFIDDVIAKIVPFCRDPDPRVRFALLQTFGTLMTDFSVGNCDDDSEALVLRFHTQICGVIDVSLNDPCARVRCHALSCTINLLEELQEHQEILILYQDGLLAKLAEAMADSSDMRVQTMALTSITAMCETLGDLAGQYYESFKQPMLLILTHARDAAFVKLRSEALRALACLVVEYVAQ